MDKPELAGADISQRQEQSSKEDADRRDPGAFGLPRCSAPKIAEEISTPQKRLTPLESVWRW